MKVTSVRLRLMVWNIGVLTLVLLGFLIAAHLLIRTYMLNTVDQRLRGIAGRHAAMLSHIPKGPLHPPGPPPPPHPMHEVRIRVFDQSGRPVSRVSDMDTSKVTPWDRAAFRQSLQGEDVFVTLKNQDPPLRVFSRPLRDYKQQFRVVQVASSLSSLEELFTTLTKLSLLLVPCAILIAAFGGLLLTKRALQPVQQIRKSAEALNPEELSQRLPVVGADEFAQLAMTMNGMLARMEEAFLRLKESIERERRFTADASHELRTPLTTIKANTSLTLRGERTPAQYREALGAVDQAADMMNHLVQDLLLLARSDSGQLKLSYQTVSPADLFRDAITMTRRQEACATVQVAVAEDVGEIWGDPHHLLRLVVNLLENALRYTPAGGEVRLNAEAQGERLLLTVRDTGMGIAPEHLPHLGERFYRVDASRARQQGGVGLGLAICHSIVTAHGGNIRIDSQPGQGTTVSVSLPRVTI